MAPAKEAHIPALQKPHRVWLRASLLGSDFLYCPPRRQAFGNKVNSQQVRRGDGLMHLRHVEDAGKGVIGYCGVILEKLNAPRRN
jgi:hypothetical protein